MDKQYILNHVNEFSAEQLANFIKEGHVSLEELRKTELLDNSMRKAILRLLEADAKIDDNAWEEVRYCDDLHDVLNWINQNRNNRNIDEAKKLADYLKKRIDVIDQEKRKILAKISRNPNSYAPFEIKSFLNDGTLSKEDLINCEIPHSAIENLDRVHAPQLFLGKTPKTIPEGFTEVYLWGHTGSGKTCALGAILHMADKKGYLNIASGPGYDYAHTLKNIFSDDNIADDFLPAPTPLETTQYLPFTLNRESEKKKRSVSLIELSGEIFKCFYYVNGNLDFPSQFHEDTYNSMKSFLKSNNRKIHFFFIDYDRNNRPDENGRTQSDYLSAASTYFNNNDVFGKSTDAIYVVLTKSDLLHDENEKIISPERRQEVAKKYINENYRSFINTLKDKCRKYSINGGKLPFVTFSLGSVYFKEICNFEGSEALKIVEILMERIRGTRQNIFDFLNK